MIPAHIPISIVSNSEQVRWELTNPLIWIFLHNNLSVDRERSIRINSDQDRPGVSLIMLWLDEEAQYLHKFGHYCNAERGFVKCRIRWAHRELSCREYLWLSLGASVEYLCLSVLKIAAINVNCIKTESLIVTKKMGKTYISIIIFDNIGIAFQAQNPCPNWNCELAVVCWCHPNVVALKGINMFSKR